MTKILGIVVHHTNSANVGGSVRTLAERNDPDSGRKGFGYHYIVPRSAADDPGAIFRLVNDIDIVWHAGNVNDCTIGVALAARDDAVVAEDAGQVEVAVNLIRYLQNKYNIPNKYVIGHGESWQWIQDDGKEVTEGSTVVNIIRNGRTVQKVDVDFLLANGNRIALQNAEFAARTYKPTPVTGISPYISALDSFHPTIQYELTRRTLASEMANAYMPFVKLTSLTNVLTPDLPDSIESAWCPSLGIHGEKTRTFEDIYTTRDNKSMVGYATTGVEGKDKTKVIVRDAAADAQTIPIPGIIKMTAERSTAGPMGVRGGLFKADISILAYSVGQVDTLLRYFLRPATRVVLELGRMSVVRGGNETFTPYDWNKSAEAITEEFTELIEDAEKQQAFINRYTYGNFGNYEVFIGYVVKFNLKYNKDNTYVIDLTIHSVQQFELPTTHTGVKSICTNASSGCAVMDVHEYFSDTYSWKENTFSKLIDATLKENGPVVRIGQQTPDRDGDGPSTQGGTRENGYFVTWQFFIEKILNDPTYGIISVLGNNTQIQTLLKLGLPRATRLTTPTDKYGLLANEVGYHPNLRSTTPSVMIINNPVAQAAYEGSLDQKIYTKVVGSMTQEEQLSAEENITIRSLISSGPKFTNHLGPGTEAGAGWLQEGVWLNTAAIKQAFTGTDTVTAAISMLLNMMNSATEGYWNLQLYSAEHGIYVIDMGLSKPITKGTEPAPLPPVPTPQVLNSLTDITLNEYKRSKDEPDIPRYLYVFNRKAFRFGTDDIGSELLDMNVEFNLPQVIAVQAIAGVGGPAQKSLLQSIDIDELNEISLIKTFNTCAEDENSVCVENTSCYNADIVQNMEDRIVELQKRRDDLQDQLGALTFGSDPRGGGLGITARANEKERLVEEITTLQEQIAVQISNENPNVVNSLREYADLGTAIELTELNPSSMMKKMNLDSRNDVTEGRKAPVAHAFSSSNLTKTVVDVTLPGIGGINLFQSFLVGRAPSILDRGFYVVTKITHEFSSQSGWITKIQGRFRFRPDLTSTGTYDLCDAGAGAGAGSGGSGNAGAGSGNARAGSGNARAGTGGAGISNGERWAMSYSQPGTSTGERWAMSYSQPGTSGARPAADTNNAPRTFGSPSETRIIAAQQRALTSIRESSLSQTVKRQEEVKLNLRTSEAITRFRAGATLNTVLLTLQWPLTEPLYGGDTAIGYRIP